MISTSNLISYWKLDESYTADTWVDSHGPNNLTRSGNCLEAIGVINNGLDTNTSSIYTGLLYIDDANQVGLDITDYLSISAWIKIPSGVGGYPTLVSKGVDTTTQSYMLYLTNSNNTWSFKTSDGTNSHLLNTPTPIIVRDRWYHYCITYNKDTKLKTIWINARIVAQATATHGADLVNSNARFLLGYFDYSSSANGRGIYDEVSIWNRVLTQSEIMELATLVSYPLGNPRATVLRS